MKPDNGVRAKLITMTPEISRQIESQMRYQDRKLVRKTRKAADDRERERLNAANHKGD
jgi:hypothetical protein